MPNGKRVSKHWKDVVDLYIQFFKKWPRVKPMKTSSISDGCCAVASLLLGPIHDSFYPGLGEELNVAKEATQGHCVRKIASASFKQ